MIMHCIIPNIAAVALLLSLFGEGVAATTRLLGSSFGPPGPATYDYVVVGGGTAGLTIATRLAEQTNRSIAVIEAGSFYEISNSNLSMIPLFGPGGSGKSPFDTYPNVDWQFRTQPQAVCEIFHALKILE